MPHTASFATFLTAFGMTRCGGFTQNQFFGPPKKTGYKS